VLLLAPLCLSVVLGGSCFDDGNGSHDDTVDLDDLAAYSQNELGRDWQTVDWCDWLANPPSDPDGLRELRLFVASYFSCDSDPLAIANANHYPTRLTWGVDAQRLYVSDADANSVFIYDNQIELLGELKNLGTPLGVAVDPLGNIYVGNNEFDNVEVYDADGLKTATLGSGIVLMPNDLALDADGNLYVADSLANLIWVFDPATGQVLRSIGSGQLLFPSALAIAGIELFVADQSNHQVKVFDLDGNLLRSLGSEATQGMIGYRWQGRFVRLQSLAVDAAGRLHALDSQMSVIQILDALDGAYLDSYGTRGTAEGELNLPLDIALNDYGELAVANTRNHRIELLTPP
jgi:DNA-binding beta-propeller fold protein YncE